MYAQTNVGLLSCVGSGFNVSSMKNRLMQRQQAYRRIENDWVHSHSSQFTICNHSPIWLYINHALAIPSLKKEKVYKAFGTLSRRLNWMINNAEASKVLVMSKCDKLKSEYSEKNLFYSHFVHHKSQTDRPEIEAVSAWWDAGDQSPDPCDGQVAPDVHINDTQKFSSYLTESRDGVHYKDRRIHAISDTNRCFCII